MGHALNPYINKVIKENLIPAFPGEVKRENLFRVVHDLHVFKAVDTPRWFGQSKDGFRARRNRIAIVNLIIPAGAIVHIPDNAILLSKCRASKAIVHSIYSLGETQLNEGYSDWSPGFKYEPGVTVKPAGRHGFAMYNGVCERGIHFFFSLSQAKAYL